MFSSKTFTTITFSDGRKGHFDGNFVYVGDPFIANAVFSVNEDEQLYEHPKAKYVGKFSGNRAVGLDGTVIFTCDQDVLRKSKK